MKKFNLENISCLVEPQYGQCVSLYLDLHRHPIWTISGMMRYRSVLREARKKLIAIDGNEAAKAMLQPIEYFACLQRDILSAKSIAFFVSRRISGFFPMSESVHDDFTIANSFHIKPIISYLNPSESWFLLDISNNNATLYKCQSRLIERKREFEFGSTDGESLALKSASVAQKCIDLYLKHSKVPIFLMASAENINAIRKKLGNVYLGIERKYFGNLSDDIVQEMVWEHVSNHFEGRRKTLLHGVLDYHRKNEALTEVTEVVKSVSEGNIETLVFARDLKLPGHINWDKCDVTFKGMSDAVDCVFDDICERALLRGARVVVSHSSELPPGVSILATVRSKLINPPDDFPQGFFAANVSYGVAYNQLREPSACITV